MEREAKREVRETMQRLAGEDFPDDAVLVGWVVVMEWMLPNHAKAVQRAAGDAADETPVPWDANKLLFEGLRGAVVKQAGADLGLEPPGGS